MQKVDCSDTEWYEQDFHSKIKWLVCIYGTMCIFPMNTKNSSNNNNNFNNKDDNSNRAKHDNYSENGISTYYF